MVNQPNFKKVMGEVKQADAVPPVPSQKKAAPAKEQSKPKEAKPKEVKKEAPPKAAEAEEEDAPKPKPKNPLDLLAPSKMILDEWKRLYSNTKTNFREVAIKGMLFIVILLLKIWLCTCLVRLKYEIDCNTSLVVIDCRFLGHV
jgi:elongation factor 1-gamma